MKLDRMFGGHDAREIRLSHALGHHEFGPGKSFINVGDTAVVREIRRELAAGHEARAWALYWTSIYGHLAAESKRPEIAASAIVVRFEDLCDAPGETVDRMVAHAELDAAAFAARREHYLQTLRAPTYYKTDFTPAELADVAEITRPVRETFGY
jgi:hypothetical protein